MKMSELVKVIDGVPTTTLSVIANGIGVSKKAARDLLIRYESAIDSVTEFKMRKVITPTKGRPVEDWILDEPQASLLIMMMRNSEKALTFKVALVKEFYDLKRKSDNGLELLNRAYAELDAYKDKGRAWSEYGRQLGKVKPKVLGAVIAAEEYAQLNIEFKERR
jgi:phage regulator Rha-like protein